jgi:hypothetical protein
MQLFVGTPNLESRVILFQQALLSSSASSSSSSSSLSLSSSEDASSSDDSDESSTERIVNTYRNFLRSVWAQDAMFMNYLESKQYASRVASIVEITTTSSSSSSSSNSNNSTSTTTTELLLNEEELSKILSQQTAVMTARGSVREEYVAQMDLSRL